MKLHFALLLSLALPSAFAEKPAEKPADPAPAAESPAKLDFGNSSSSTLTGKAWQALDAKKYADAIAYTAKCQELFKTKALEMQKALKEAVPSDEKEKVAALYALNDVGTCLFIQGRALEEQGKKKEALEAYQNLTKTLAFAQCWNPDGFYWKPADAASERIAELEKPAK